MSSAAVVNSQWLRGRQQVDDRAYRGRETVVSSSSASDKGDATVTVSFFP